MSSADGTPRRRAGDLGIRIGAMEPGRLNAITDVAGVGVGHRTLVEGTSVRTGVTVVMPHDGDVWTEALFAGAHRLNGNGEMTGLEWIRENGMLNGAIGLTNTHSVGVVRDALIEHATRSGASTAFWSLPVVAETWDGRLNDINGFHVRAEHVFDALGAVSRGQVAEGSVGGGTGMVSFGFKAGIGTASRIVPPLAGAAASRAATPYTVGVLVQANFGRREWLTVGGVPVGRSIGADVIPLPVPQPDKESGSVIAIVATDAPLLPHQCERVAQRVSLGIGRTGGAGGNSSGDLFLCFATGNRGMETVEYTRETPQTRAVAMLDDNHIDGLFHAVIEATEEAVVNAMLAAETMTGHNGVIAHALPPDMLVEVLRAGWSPVLGGRT